MQSLSDKVQEWIEGEIEKSDHVPILFLSGAQGIGKSFVARQMVEVFGGRVAVLSIDDFYLRKADRRRLAERVHPLFVTRGPPGTHDLALLNAVLDRLLAAAPETVTLLPRFDKVRDTRCFKKEWTAFKGRPAAILMEGWLMGVLPCPASAMEAPLNAVEAEDPDGLWRGYQEACLASSYARLWDRAASFFHIDAPDFDTVLRWRIEQEETTLGLEKGSLPEPRKAWVQRFVLHYERLTRRMLDGQRRPGLSVRVDKNRRAMQADPPGA